jgi:exodeoxyribonuclease I
MAIASNSQESNGDGTFFWYDLETTGTDPRTDRIIQFAGVRTNLELDEIEPPFGTYVRCPVDVLPDPSACAVTGLTPQRINREGMGELEAYVAINRRFAQPNTCVAGFNSLRFDDEFIRFGFYRHFIDPYAREWQSGNSRWDIIDLARAAAALRPDGISWPTEAGLPSFRLGELTAANGIEHAAAHDALSDVRATIGLARLIRDKKRRLFDYFLGLRDRGRLHRMLRPESPQMGVHVSRMYPRERSSLAVVMPVARHPQNRNSIVVVDLASDVRPLIEWNADRLKEALFSTDRDDRPGLKEVRLNHCPFVAPLTVVRDEDARRLELDLPEMRRRFETLRESSDLAAKIAAVYGREGTRDAVDADAALYDGFISDPDRERCGDTLAQLLGGEPSPDITFADQRLNELLFRLRARRDGSSLSVPERNRWRAWMRHKLVEGIGDALTLSKFRQALAELDAPSEIVEALYEHAQAVELSLVNDVGLSR